MLSSDVAALPCSHGHAAVKAPEPTNRTEGDLHLYVIHAVSVYRADHDEQVLSSVMSKFGIRSECG